MLATRTLSVRLQSDVVYVTGTVNDVPTTWTQQENGTWMTTADRAADDVYRAGVNQQRRADVHGLVHALLRAAQPHHRPHAGRR